MNPKASNSDSNQPDWVNRLPGEQWVMLDSIETAEAYLSTYKQPEVRIIRPEYPNTEWLYARIQFHDRITENKIFISPTFES